MDSGRRTSFIDPTLQAELKDFGFAKVKLLSSSEVGEFLDFYTTDVSGFGEGDFLHTHVAPTEVKYKVHSFVEPRMHKLLENILVNHKVGLGFFMIKPSYGKTPMRVHQDKSLVDEEIYTGLTVWCPLVDVDESNGSLLMIPRSHLFLKNHRGTNIDLPYKAIEDFVEQDEFAQPLTVRAGEAVIFDHRLWHASTANTSGIDRVVVAAVAVPTESSYVHFERHANGALQMYAVADDFPLEFDVNSPLSSSCVLQNDSLPLDDNLTEQEFIELYNKFNPPIRKPSLWKKLFSNIMSSD